MVDEILDDEKVWAKFTEFFKFEKGYIDWTDEEIDLSRNNDDFVEFVKWLCTNDD